MTSLPVGHIAGAGQDFKKGHLRGDQLVQVAQLSAVAGGDAGCSTSCKLLEQGQAGTRPYVAHDDGVPRQDEVDEELQQQGNGVAVLCRQQILTGRRKRGLEAVEVVFAERYGFAAGEKR